jgi:hypothetical protein
MIIINFLRALFKNQLNLDHRKFQNYKEIIQFISKFEHTEGVKLGFKLTENYLAQLKSRGVHFEKVPWTTSSVLFVRFVKKTFPEFKDKDFLFYNISNENLVLKFINYFLNDVRLSTTIIWGYYAEKYLFKAFINIWGLYPLFILLFNLLSIITHNFPLLVFENVQTSNDIWFSIEEVYINKHDFPYNLSNINYISLFTNIELRWSEGWDNVNKTVEVNLLIDEKELLPTILEEDYDLIELSNKQSGDFIEWVEDTNYDSDIPSTESDIPSTISKTSTDWMEEDSDYNLRELFNEDYLDKYKTTDSATQTVASRSNITDSTSQTGSLSSTFDSSTQTSNFLLYEFFLSAHSGNFSSTLDSSTQTGNISSTLDSSTQTEFFPAQTTKNENIEKKMWDSLSEINKTMDKLEESKNTISQKIIADLEQILYEEKTYKVDQNTNKVDNSTQTEPFSLTDHKNTINTLRESMSGLEKIIHKK